MTWLGAARRFWSGLAVLLALGWTVPAWAQLSPEMQAWQTRKSVRSMTTMPAAGLGAPGGPATAAGAVQAGQAGQAGAAGGAVQAGTAGQAKPVTLTPPAAATGVKRPTGVAKSRALQDEDRLAGPQGGGPGGGMAQAPMLPADAQGQQDAVRDGEARKRRIVIRPAACVVGPKVLLGEIADPVPGADPARFAELAKKALWLAPKPGRPLSIQKIQLKELLQEHLGEEAALCDLPRQLLLQTGGRVFLENELGRIVDDFLAPRLASLASTVTVAGDGGATVEKRDLRLPPYVFLTDAGDALFIEAVTEIKPGRVGLKFLAKTAEGRIYRQAAAALFLDVWGTVPVTAIPVNTGAILTPEAVTFERKNLAFLKGKLWDGKGGPYRVKRALGVGQTLSEDLIEAPPLVAKGARVTLIFEGENIRLQAPAEALADARAGEKIQVKNLLSQKEIVALVRDAQTVVVK